MLCRVAALRPANDIDGFSFRKFHLRIRKKAEGQLQASPSVPFFAALRPLRTKPRHEQTVMNVGSFP